jgi:3-deoxy-D-manno-octulosonic-acid transferase
MAAIYFYAALGTLLTPVAALVVALGGLFKRDWWDGLAHRFGFAPRQAGRPIVVWCASVGEVNTAHRLIRRLEEKNLAPVLIATYTPSGLARARSLFGPERVVVAPLDTYPVAAAWMKRVQPRLLVLFETELWPMAIQAAHRVGALVTLVNGRLSDRSWPRYRLVAPVLRGVVAQIDAVLAQSGVFADRFVELGAAPGTTRAMGSLKFDLTPPEPPEKSVQNYYEKFAAGRRLLVAGSTHADEEYDLAMTVRRLKKKFPELALVVAPRHVNRSDEAARAIASAGLTVTRRSEMDTAAAMKADAVLVDRIGELGWLYEMATVAFVGGSLARVGGHNVLEPAGAAAAVLVGPHTENFRLEVEALTAGGGLVTTPNVAALEAKLTVLLQDNAKRAAMVAGAQKVLDAHQGATDRIVDLLVMLLGRRG